MLKSLYPHVDWSVVRIVGCDMDGTLYDEAEFISQVYGDIADLLASRGHVEPGILYGWMFQRWVEKGSSYQHIFHEAAVEASIPCDEIPDIVSCCLDLFRSYRPSLTLPSRTKVILANLIQSYTLFLVSDGSAELQQRKFDALKLSRWFDPANVGIAGYYGHEFCKPSLKIIDEIGVLSAPHIPHQIVYFGDRAVDAEFAANAGFQFARVACMHLVKPG